jgi:hypothetical protein
MAIGSPQWMYASGEAYELEQSLKFEDGRSTYLSRTPAADGNRKTWTLSYWIKRGGVADHKSHFGGSLSGSASVGVQIQFDGNKQQLLITDYRAGYQVDWSAKSNMAFRDLSGWYHIVIAVDTTQSTASDRVKLYANGELLSLTTYNAPSLNFDTKFNQNSIQVIGAATDNLTPTNFYEGYMSEVNFLDGVVATPADFGETGDYGEWKPIEYSGTYGTNGFYLPFKQDYTVEGFSTVTYKGTGSTNYIGGTGFSPSMTWIKSTAGSRDNLIFDKVRGQSKPIVPNATGAEETHSTTFESFNTDGFTVGTPAGSGGANTSGERIVAWNWDMGADTPTGFSAVTYKGNGGTQSISGFGFSPDLVWIKQRTEAYNHGIWDTVRGATKELFPNLTNSEANETTGLTSFDPDGFTVGSRGNQNENNDDLVAWGWDMGNTTATNTSGSITSTVRANTTYGQSIVSYQGSGTVTDTVGHGLNSAPEMIIVKNRETPSSGTSNWAVGHTGLTSWDYRLELENTGAENSGRWNNTAPTSSSFTLGSGTDTNDNGKNHIAYCFHSVSGYSKIGSYSGTGSSGNSITTGFRPAFLLVKNANRAENWAIVDSTRNPINPATKALFPNSSEVEQDNAVNAVDFNSNNFTVDSTDDRWNRSGDTYIYMAFAGGMDSISDYNTDGSIDSRVKASTTYGQSIVSYTGNGSSNQTVGHGLSQDIDMVIVKNRSAGTTDNWRVWHTGLTSNTHFLGLNQTSAQDTSSTVFNGHSSSTFTIGNDSAVNNNGNDFIAYCFHSVTGYSKFGSYTGDGSTSKQITTGFKPAFVMIKNADTTYRWYMLDNTRDPSNPAYHRLFAEQSGAEATNSNILEFNDTGFKLITSDAEVNQNGSTHIYMAFADTREYAYWLDQSGNNNDWTSNNLTESDISVDSPTNNFATLNPLIPDAYTTLSEGNLKIVHGSSFGGQFASQISESGKWYAEYLVTTVGLTKIGIASANRNLSDSDPQNWSEAFWYNQDGTQRDGSTDSSYGASYTNGDIIGIKLDQDNNTIDYSKNGVYQGSISLSGKGIGTNPTFIGTAGRDSTGIWNFGQDSSFAGNKTAQGNQDSNDIGDFYYTPPTGFLALCTKNLPDVAVIPSEHFNTVTWTGTGSAISVSGVGFQPDLVWGKNRAEAWNHYLFDAVRGTGKLLQSNLTNAETNNDIWGYLSAFNSDGFSLSAGSSGIDQVNDNSDAYVAWNWKANGSGSSNTNGSITSTVSANVDAGFSIVSYTANGTSGATVGHGLSSTPEMVIVKSRDTGTKVWTTYHQGMDTTAPEDYAMYLNQTDAKSNHIGWWNDTAPTSSVFTLGNDGHTNNNGDNFIAYCFHSVDGYSKVGSYTGNNNADGTFVYTSFAPAFILWKNVNDAGTNWLMVDNKRDTFNPNDDFLYANASTAEEEDYDVDFLSNGFKHRSSSSWSNGNGKTYIYIAFAETPFKYSNGK